MQIIIDITSAPAGARYFDPATERHQPAPGRTFRLGIPETSYPSGRSSSSGPIAVRTPFGVAVVHHSSFCGSTVLSPLSGLDGGGWDAHEAFEVARATSAPLLSAGGMIPPETPCTCWRCKTARRAEPGVFRCGGH